MSSDPLLNIGEDTILREEASPFSSTHTQDLLLTVSFEQPPLDNRSSLLGCGDSSLAGDPLNNNFFIFSEANGMSMMGDNSGGGMLTASTPDPPEFVVRGSPGRTPFPHDKVLPSVPFNTPEVDGLEELLREETAKQEAAFRDRLSQMECHEEEPEGSDYPLDTPKRAFQKLSEATSGKAGTSSKRTLSRCMDEEESTEEVEGGSSSTLSSVKSKEMMRRDRIKNSLEVLKRIVPGISDSNDQNEIFRQTTRYLLFLREKVGAKFDRDFLSHFLP